MTLVEDRVRDGVRSRGIDPQGDPEAVRKLVDATVAEILDERSIESQEGLADAATLTQRAFSAVAGFGPLPPFFDDPEIEELWINERLTASYGPAVPELFAPISNTTARPNTNGPSYTAGWDVTWKKHARTLRTGT